MFEIKTLSDGRKQIVDDSGPRACFDKIVPMWEGSRHLVCLKKTDTHISCLYDTELERYFGTSSSDASPVDSSFRDFHFISAESRTFVARRRDGLCQLYNDKGYYTMAVPTPHKWYKESNLFLFVGKEHHGKRVAWLQPNKQSKRSAWIFFDCIKGEVVKGFQYKEYKEKESLWQWLNGDCFSKKYIHEDGEFHYGIIKYNSNGKWGTISGYFDSIEEENDIYIIGSFHHKDYSKAYKLIKEGKVVGTYDTRPIYDEKNRCYKAKAFGQWYIIKDGTELTNCRWTEDNFKFYDQYILNKSGENTGWRIYDATSAKWLCQDWRNIRLDESQAAPTLIVDTDTLLDYRVDFDGIKKHEEELTLFLYQLVEKHNKLANGGEEETKVFVSHNEESNADKSVNIEGPIRAEDATQIENHPNKEKEEVQTCTYSLGDIIASDLMAQQHYRIYEQKLYILVDETNLANIDYIGHSYRQYQILGEGQDFRFVQDSNPRAKINLAIRDNQYEILLIKKDADNHNILFDKAECLGYSVLNQSRIRNGQEEKRKVIIFTLQSLSYKTDWQVFI